MTISAGADAAAAGAKTISAGADAASAGADAASAGAKTISTGADVASAGAKTISTGADVIAEAAETAGESTAIREKLESMGGRRKITAMSRHILVTGGAGFIGSHLVERLLVDGKSVVVIDDCSTGSLDNLQAVRENPRLQIFQSKVSECRERRALVENAESIYHLAAAVGVELILKSSIATIKTNLDETETILETASEFGVPLLLASTSEVYGKSAKPAFSEEDDLLIGPPHLSRWSYACSKLMDEFLALAYAKEKQLPVVIARLFNTVGPRQTGRYGMVLPRFIAAAKRGEPLKVFGDGKQTRCFCYVLDTVEALVRLQNCENARGEIFNVGNPEEISIEALAKLVLECAGSSSQIEFVNYEKAYAAGFEDMLRRQPVVKKLEERTGFRAKTSLRRIVELTAGK